MSMNRLAIVAAIGTHNSMKNRTDDIRYNKHPSYETRERPNGNTFNGNVNVLLGGAMFSVVVSIVCFLCYCCHRNLKRRDTIYRQRWMNVDPNMDIYSVEQYFDITANTAIDEDQYTQIMRNHGPPPSYEIAVAMKNPMEKCHLCQNKVRMNCSCDLRVTTKGDKADFDKTESFIEQTPDQLLNVKNVSHQRGSLCCDYASVNQGDVGEICQMCDEEMQCKTNNLCDGDENGNSQEDGYCQCRNSCTCVRSCGKCGKDIHRVPDTTNSNDITDNVPSTSGDGNFCQNGDINSNYEESDEDDDDDDDEEAEFDSLNENGLIRVDMRKIIDQTGLPTYEAALKLESSGYV